MEVPLMVFVAVLLVFRAEVRVERGAKMSTHVQKLEKDERASVLVEEPTVSAAATRPGDSVQASRLSLPAAIAYVTPELIEFCTAVSSAVSAPPPRLMLATAGLR